jgi:two-component system, chemotaxis family, sensor kinase Cph1
MKTSRGHKDSEDLRTRAEESLKSGLDRLDEIGVEDAACLIHELRVHQVELEMQNEELRRVQDDLEQSRSHYADLYDFAPVGYLTLNKSGRIENLNLTAARLLGIERGYLINQHFQNFIFPPDKKSFFSHLKAIFDERARQIVEIRLSPKAGRQFYARLESIYLAVGDEVGLCMTNVSDVSLSKKAELVLQNAHDELERCVTERTAELAKANELLRLEIAERERAERELKVYAGQLELSNRELQDFAFVASHDMQEPLRKIQAFANLIQEKYAGSLDDQGRDFFERLTKAAKRMSDMIQGLLEFSRVTTRPNPFISTDLTLLVREVMSDIQLLIERSRARIEVLDLPTIEADPIQMRRLFQNLIINSLKFHGRQEPVIKIYAEPAGMVDAGDGQQEVKSYRISVEDNGIGFDEKHLDRIFTLFQRLQGRSASDGTGMGLAICRRIVERHKGRITARSRPDHGATFVITLPEKQLEDRLSRTDK